ncbi:MAG: RluA family pseudouridine synthase [Planctomycetota bacterium]
MFLANDLEILLEDGPCLAVNKPAGILTQGPPSDDDTLVRRVKQFLKVRENKPSNVYLGIPHRLDRAVSGVVLFAKNSKAASRLAEQFRDRLVRKIYWAIVPTEPQPVQGSMINWLDKVPDLPMARVVPGLTPTAKEGILQYRVLRQVELGWLVEIELTTGRFHQIRVQLAHHGYPILGDSLYGSEVPFLPEGIPAEPLEEQPIALHARRLTFLHPVRYEPITVTAPLPRYWRISEDVAEVP